MEYLVNLSLHFSNGQTTFACVFCLHGYGSYFTAGILFLILFYPTSEFLVCSENPVLIQVKSVLFFGFVVVHPFSWELPVWFLVSLNRADKKAISSILSSWEYFFFIFRSIFFLALYFEINKQRATQTNGKQWENCIICINHIKSKGFYPHITWSGHQAKVNQKVRRMPFCAYQGKFISTRSKSHKYLCPKQWEHIHTSRKPLLNLIIK